jgi:pSer/pThr/pTyr-binding forkhead associated (FHA) protein
MKPIPVIVVQLVHILGPMKGEIQEFFDEAISIGRDPSCNIQFSSDLTSISRNHAEIIREGNRFKLVDHSSNGTFVNGKKVSEIYLSAGDVLEFAEGGPKVSFLTEKRDAPTEVKTPSPQPQEIIEEPQMPVRQEPVYEKVEPQKPEFAPPELRKPEAVSGQRVQAPLIIQYGPTLRSYKELPVTIGKSLKCEFILDHPSILDLHAQILFDQNQYWIKDLTGQQLLQINLKTVGLQSPMKVDDEISLSLQGPVFRFLGEGRLAEVAETPAQEEASSFEKEEKAVPAPEMAGEKMSKKIISKVRDYLDRIEGK